MKEKLRRLHFFTTTTSNNKKQEARRRRRRMKNEEARRRRMKKQEDEEGNQRFDVRSSSKVQNISLLLFFLPVEKKSTPDNEKTRVDKQKWDDSKHRREVKTKKQRSEKKKK